MIPSAGQHHQSKAKFSLRPCVTIPEPTHCTDEGLLWTNKTAKIQRSMATSTECYYHQNYHHQMASLFRTLCRFIIVVLQGTFFGIVFDVHIPNTPREIPNIHLLALTLLTFTMSDWPPIFMWKSMAIFLVDAQRHLFIPSVTAMT